MKKIIYSLMLVVVSAMQVIAQTGNLPIKEWKKNDDAPLVLYLTGDGGFNKFSNGLCDAISNSGYSVAAINSHSYFWDKKTPGQTVVDFTPYLVKQFIGRKNQELILAGYSFGADVMPFIVNRLPDVLKKKLLSVILLSPSTSTDFEIHWSDIFGGNKKRSMDVVAEINKMQVPKTAIIFGNDEDDFPIKDITIKNFSTENLPGGHHYDGSTGEVAKTMIKYFK